MSSMRLRRTISLIAVAALLLVTIGISSLRVQAFDYPKLLNRSLRLGTTEPGESTDYTISWRYPSNTNVRSVRMILCANAYVLDPCSNTPAGDFSAATLASQVGAVTGFAIDSQAANEIVMTRAASAAGTGQSTYVFEDIVNPSGIHSRFFIQIFTYSTPDATGQPNHISSVASATAEPIVINGEVPPILYFCAALTIDEWCENVDGNFIDYGDLDPVNGHWGTSQFGAATNALGGYVVTINGKTMTSGNKIIEPLDTPDVFTPGVQQFGLNLRANSIPALGQDAFGAGIGVVDSDYDVPDMFKYTDGDVVAASAAGTLFNTFTVTYILNVDPDLPSGIYNTTVAYICTAAF